MTSRPLQSTLEELLSVAGLRHLDPEAASLEGEQLVAAVAEPAVGAFADWSEQTGREVSSQEFFSAVSNGRRWRAMATPLMTQTELGSAQDAASYRTALCAAIAAACTLGKPNPLVADLATEAQPVAQAENEQASVDELLAELDGLIGLAQVKSEIRRQAAILHVQVLRAEAGLKVPTITRHLIFVGNPGTGKTTVARLVAGIYNAVGLLSKGQLVEVDRSELVAGYVGQTATKTAEVVKSALGGVLFIDEAYSLSGDQYGEECITTLVKEMEDNRDDLVVIVAGYPGPMSRFIAQNPGLASRFRTSIEFADYSDDELVQIFVQMVEKSDYDLAPGGLEAFDFLVSREIRDEGLGNGRYCRNVLEVAIGRQSWRLHDCMDPNVKQLRLITANDILGEVVMNPGDELAVQANSAAGDYGGFNVNELSGSPLLDGDSGVTAQRNQL